MSVWNRVGTAVALGILAGTLCTRSQAAVQLPQSADAPLPTRTACDAGRGLQLTLGLPEDHPPIQTPQTSRFAAAEQVCLSTARGNPYQLLNWLENDHLQVVVLPAFAVAILARTDPAGFDDNYLVSDVSPFPLLRLEERTLDLVGGGGAVRGEQAMQRLLERAHSGTPFTVALPHHLSMSVDQLLAAATRWADGQGLKGEARLRFASTVVDAMRFQLPLDEAPMAAADFAYVEMDARSGASTTRAVDRQLLVVHRHILSGYPELQRAVATVQPSNAAKLTESLFTWLTGDAAPRGQLRCLLHGQL
ncbi:MAG: hypothetical protein HC872_01320 [Gammaproteobacteria bacterium]|nr:hypothetical protein [Gammaproteobacteria bacterium]